MKTVIALVSFLSILIFINLAIGQDGILHPGTEPDSFRGIKWETDISKLKGMKFFMSSSGLESYVRPSDDLTGMGKIKLKNVIYTFRKEKFFSGTNVFEGESSYFALKFLLEQTFGKGRKISKRDLPEGTKEGYGWIGNKVGITLQYSDVLGIGNCVTMYKPIYEQMVKEGLVK